MADTRNKIEPRNAIEATQARIPNSPGVWARPEPARRDRRQAGRTLRHAELTLYAAGCALLGALACAPMEGFKWGNGPDNVEARRILVCKNSYEDELGSCYNTLSFLKRNDVSPKVFAAAVDFALQPVTATRDVSEFGSETEYQYVVHIRALENLLAEASPETQTEILDHPTTWTGCELAATTGLSRTTICLKLFARHLETERREQALASLVTRCSHDSPQPCTEGGALKWLADWSAFDAELEAKFAAERRQWEAEAEAEDAAWHEEQQRKRQQVIVEGVRDAADSLGRSVTPSAPPTPHAVQGRQPDAQCDPVARAMGAGAGAKPCVNQATNSQPIQPSPESGPPGTEQNEDSLSPYPRATKQEEQECRDQCVVEARPHEKKCYNLCSDNSKKTDGSWDAAAYSECIPACVKRHKMFLDCCRQVCKREGESTCYY